MSQSQIYENNESHLKQIKELRARIDGTNDSEKLINEKEKTIKVLRQDVLDLQTQIQVQKEIIEVNSSEFESNRINEERMHDL